MAAQDERRGPTTGSWVRKTATMSIPTMKRLGIGKGAPRRERSGISLLVVVATLTLIAAIAAVVIPAVFRRGDITLDNAGRLLARELRAAQGWAAHHGHPVTFVFEASGDGYRVVDHLGEVIVRSDPPGTFERRYSSDAVFEGVRISAVDFGPERAVTFAADGGVSRGGSVTVTFKDEQLTVTVSAPTGSVAITGLSGERNADH